MKKELLILAMAVGCTPIACVGHVSTPAEAEMGVESCAEAIEVEADYQDALIELDNAEVDESALDDMRAENNALKEEIAELLSENDALIEENGNLKSALAYQKLRYDGLLEQLRKIQDAYGVVVAEYSQYKNLYELCGGVWINVEVEDDNEQ